MLRTQNLQILRGRKIVLTDITLELNPGKSSAYWGLTVPAKVRCWVPCVVSCRRIMAACGSMSAS